MPIDRRQLPEISDHIKRTWRPRRRDRSAGGVVFRRMAAAPRSHARAAQQPGAYIALIATHQRRRWQLPKGTQEEGESTLQTALREVYEEVGLATQPERYLKTVEYWYWDTYRKTVPHLVHKQVTFYLLRAIGGTLTDASHEVDAVAWFAPQDALERLTFPAERRVLRLALAQFPLQIQPDDG